MLIQQQIEMREGEEEEEILRIPMPYTLTSHTITNSSQEAQRKAGGLWYLREALGVLGCKGGGLNTRRNMDCRFQLSHKVVTERQGQPAKAV